MKHCVKFMALFLFLFSAVPCMADDDTFIRVDRDDFNAWNEELANVRFLEEEHMSGSAQFSEDQFHELAVELKDKSDNVWIIDCRLESHGLINGIAVSWCGEGNGANLNKTVEEVEKEEESFAGLTGTSVMEYTSEDDHPVDGREVLVESWQTERSLAEDEGFHYLRLACPDHCWPDPDLVDAFIDFASDLEEDEWLHFHCQAGSGRTGAFMTIYEMIQNPDAPVEEILQHQADTGSGNLVDRAKPEKSYDQKNRCVFAREVYNYIRENRESGFGEKWSGWLREHSHHLTMEKGTDLPIEGAFSSDQLIVDDSFKAEAEGEAVVLVGDDIYFITVE